MDRPTAGDIFTLPITAEEHLSGRVLLDVAAQCFAPARLAADSPLGFFQGAILVEIHGVAMPRPGVGDGRVLVPSVFVAAAALTSGRWPVVGHRAVDPTQLDFPPALLLVGPRPHLIWGELRLPVAMAPDELDALDVSPTLHTSALDQIALVALGRQADVDRTRYRKLDALRLERSDLRFHPAAADVFARAGLPARPRYFDEALARGFDPRRFYAT